MNSPEIAAEIRELTLSRPYDGRLVELRENRGGWRYTGLYGTCVCTSKDGKRLVLAVEIDPDRYWPVGYHVLVYLDHETAAVFYDAVN